MRSPLTALALLWQLTRAPKPTDHPRPARPIPTREQLREDMQR